jgi:protein TonB
MLPADPQPEHAMVGTLIESRATRQRRAGGSLASVIVHSLLITGAVFATARDSVSAPKPHRVEVTYVPTTHLPEPEPRRVAASQRRVDQLPVVSRVSLPRFDAPSVVPTTIPEIDPNAVATTDFINARGITPAGCGVTCSIGSGIVDSAATLMGADLLMQLKEAVVPPRYPEALRRSGIDGSVVAKFVVDTTGRVDMSTLEFVKSDHELFANAVRSTIERLRFNPAVVAGRKTRVAAMMPFHFRLK